ncbi:MAG: CapA family protein [Solirubrobacteraceae bacterium]|nr:CapA family protein [Solirubrobacteraceae bacterium]
MIVVLAVLVVGLMVLRAAGDPSPQVPGAVGRADAAEPKPKRPIEVTWVGDMTFGSARGLPPNRGRDMLGAVREQLVSDAVLGNLEGTFGTGGTTKCGAQPSATCFAFQAPPANARALRDAGFDLVSLANNHAWDAGAAGMARTVRALRDVGVAYNGRPGEITVLRRGGRRIAVLGFAAYRWTSPITDLAKARAFVADAARRADTVIVTFHAGAEGRGAQRTPTGPESGYGEPRGDVRAFARAAIDAGADLVLGAGPHVLRGMEVYRDRLIAYSLGNFAGWDTFSLAGPLGESAVLRVTLDGEGRATGGRLVPVRLEGKGVPRLDPDRTAIRRVAALSRADFGDAAAPIDADGRLLGDAHGRAPADVAIPTTYADGSPAPAP